MKCVFDSDEMHLSHRKCLDSMGLDVCLHCGELPTCKSISITFHSLMNMNVDYLACEATKRSVLSVFVSVHVQLQFN